MAWLTEHALCDREWPVDDLYWLASEDFAPALDLTLPPRRVFLGALQARCGVTVTYDRRDGRPVNGKWRKTTFYRFAVSAESLKIAA